MAKNLTELEKQLAKSKDYDGRKNNTVELVKGFFIDGRGMEPSGMALNEYYLEKSYLKLEITIPSKASNRSELEIAFFELVNKALFLRQKKDLKASNNYFKKAKKIAGLLKKDFYTDYYDFCVGLKGVALKKKLQCDMRYEKVNATLESNKHKGTEVIGAGLLLAAGFEKKNTKLLLDFLGKCLYVLYEKFPHCAMSLGFYLEIETTAIGYETLTCWIHFHKGNIYLYLGDAKRAKNEFTQALKIAEASKFDYAIMTMYERIGLASKNLTKDRGEKDYRKSLQVGQTTNNTIPKLVIQNRVRCLLSLGNIYCRRRKYDQSECCMKEALTLANLVNYTVNTAAIISSLGDLYRAKYNDRHKDAKHFHGRAYKMKTEKLGRGDSHPRVAHDKKYM